MCVCVCLFTNYSNLPHTQCSSVGKSVTASQPFATNTFTHTVSHYTRRSSVFSLLQQLTLTLTATHTFAQFPFQWNVVALPLFDTETRRTHSVNVVWSEWTSNRSIVDKLQFCFCFLFVFFIHIFVSLHFFSNSCGWTEIRFLIFLCLFDFICGEKIVRNISHRCAVLNQFDDDDCKNEIF